MLAKSAADYAEALFQADLGQQQIPLINAAEPAMTMDDAYVIQDELVARWKAHGSKQVGWKIGLTSKAMQAALNIDIPDSGVLFDHMVYEDRATIPSARFIQLRMEAEIAFVMKTDLSGPDCTPEQVAAATAYVAPSIELLDTRIVRSQSGQTRTVLDTISDNAANAGVILGTQQHAVDAFDLRRVGAIVSRDGEVEETGLGAGILGDPLVSMAWLANRLAAYGQKISAGDIVLSGSFIRPIECPPRSEIKADFGAFGSVELGF